MTKLQLPLLIILAVYAGGADAAEEKPSCIFCEIIAGRVPAAVVYRDETVVAFMDHAPLNPGHVLIMPIQHADGLLDLPPATAGHLMQVAQILARAIRATDIRAEGFRVMLNSGKSAGQEVPHAHLHLIPHYRGDDKTPVQPLAELERVAAKIRAGLGQAPSAGMPMPVGAQH